MNNEYFILSGNEKLGPYSIETLKQTGIDRNTKIWHEGLAKWTRASEIPELSVLLSPPASSGKKWILATTIIIAVAGVAFTTIKLWPKQKAVVLAKTSLDNQQLYNRYASSVVLIQNRFMYRITAGDQTYFFNGFYSYNDYNGFLSGLTNDSLVATQRAEAVQGTGFFVSADGKILTNRHVVQPPPNENEKDIIANCFIGSLEGAVTHANFRDSLNRKIIELDSLLTALEADTVANSGAIADAKEKKLAAEEFFDMEDGDDVAADSATVNYIKTQKLVVEKITLELRIFSEGTSDINSDNGINCSVVSMSEDENVDLAILQTASKQLPDTTIKTIDLTRIGKINSDDKLLPQMSEHLILIGFNSGSDLAQTTEGIQAQLTDGKVSQNTDAYKLMYTIPTLPGSSGSPVMDEKGRLVSVNFAGITETQSFNYGIQPGQIRRFLKSNGISLL